jgi:hypothetical protein
MVEVVDAGRDSLRCGKSLTTGFYLYGEFYTGASLNATHITT